MDVSVRAYLHQLSGDIGCNLEDLPGAMDDWDGWRVSKPVLSA